MLKLIIEDDENQVKVVRLLRDEITIGRKEGSTIRLTERNVSRKHAKLLKKGDDIVLEDLGSYNGVKVNGVKISEPVEIDEGDKIIIGDYTLMLKVEEKTEEDPFEEMATIPVERMDEEALKAMPSIPSNQDAAATLPMSDEQNPAKSSEPPAVATPVASKPATSAKSPTIEQSKQARLVVLTSNYQGSNFQLTNNSMIIGRNRENDIFIDHQSLSAIHAKITYEGGTYTISDMGSKNGMRINGDEYEKMALRKGDIIDLGHVRFRFVAPGEVYDFASESAHELSSEANNKKNLFIIIALVVIAGIIFILVFPSLFGKKKGSDSSSNSSTFDIASMTTSVNTFISAKSWQKAIDLLNKSKLEPNLSNSDKTSIEKLLGKVKKEKSNKELLSELDKLAKHQKWAAIYTKGAKVSSDSVYFRDATAKVKNAKSSFLTLAIAKSKAAMTNKNCVPINQFLEDAKLFKFTTTELKSLKDLSTKCSTVSPTVNNNSMASNNTMTAPAMNYSPMNNVVNNTAMNTTNRPMNKTMQHTMKTISMLPDMKTNSNSGKNDLAIGLAAYRSGNCSAAVRKLKRAYSHSHSSKAAKYIGLCGCKNKRKSWAKWAYSRLSGGTKRSIKKLCKKRGINL